MITLDRFSEVLRVCSQAAAIAVVVLFNALMSMCTRYMARFERHHTRANMEVSVSWSVFVGQYINTALVGLLVYASIDSVNESLKDTQSGRDVLEKIPIFGGLFADISNR